ncbi:hypothetical protein E2C01_060281 [Portunus trituberculatus]|uniref:Uncharacterized protein n=1 Tax=Portunus trituberculatus TaxID=210409 RepID=A0A5B7H8A5_PORTR|nr:hypothetical protein [Portunus trituberculatus]
MFLNTDLVVHHDLQESSVSTPHTASYSATQVCPHSRRATLGSIHKSWLPHAQNSLGSSRRVPFVTWREARPVPDTGRKVSPACRGGGRW